jgi:hypothetical protein
VPVCDLSVARSEFSAHNWMFNGGLSVEYEFRADGTLFVQTIVACNWGTWSVDDCSNVTLHLCGLGPETQSWSFDGQDLTLGDMEFTSGPTLDHLGCPTSCP